jgi:RimJ/RimL family protein N-acetyltransferase
MSGEASLTLREAGLRDAEVLWQWANDAETRRAAWDRAPIPWEDHLQWLGRTLASPAARTWIGVTENGELAGSIRFDTIDEWRTARLSYVVAPALRGKGYGRQLVETGVAAIRLEKPESTIVAEVRRGNEASLRVFRRLGWIEDAGDETRSQFRLTPSTGDAA